MTDNITLSSGTMTLDLNGKNLTAASTKRLFYINGASFTLKGTGGGFLVGNGTVSGFGGGVSVKSGSFTMEGGSITGCSATWGGGGVQIPPSNGIFSVNGTATVAGNTKTDGSKDNVNLYEDASNNAYLKLTGPFTGTVFITKSAAAAGKKFGVLDSGSDKCSPGHRTHAGSAHRSTCAADLCLPGAVCRSTCGIRCCSGVLRTEKKVTLMNKR